MHCFPRTIGLIMDGNRRWANTRFLPVVAGHKKGAKSLKQIVKRCAEINIEQLTVFAFSTENWNRVPSEISSLMNLLENYIKSEIAEIHNNNLRFKVIGNRNNLSSTLIKLINHAQNLTNENTGLQLNVCIDYGGKSDILEATKSIVKKVKADELKIEDIDYDVFNSHLLSKEIKDLDLLIRTSGETRLSNFMLWQTAYTELYFTETLWPDFSVIELNKALDFYRNRERRYGASNAFV